MWSDVHLKENVTLTGTVLGLNGYTYNYIGDNVTYKGVLAQEVLDTKYAGAVEMQSNGFYKVDYSKLPKGLN